MTSHYRKYTVLYIVQCAVPYVKCEYVTLQVDVASPLFLLVVEKTFTQYSISKNFTLTFSSTK
jgi:hypothetical protein